MMADIEGRFPVHGFLLSRKWNQLEDHVSPLSSPDYAAMGNKRRIEKLPKGIEMRFLIIQGNRQRSSRVFVVIAREIHHMVTVAWSIVIDKFMRCAATHLQPVQDNQNPE